MKISRNWLQKYFNKDLPQAEELAELFAFHAFEVEGVEKTGSDQIMDIKVLPDRAHYALSHYGVAKEVSLLTKIAIDDKSLKLPETAISDKPEIKVSDSDFCRRYVARIAEFSDMPEKTPDWLKNSLEAIGQRTINPIVDIMNYVMYDIGQPLHAFDLEKVKKGLNIRYAKKGESIILLDGRKIDLDSSDSVIADEAEPLVIAGIKGGKTAEIGNDTRKIIIESANFHPTKVRRTSTKHDIRSDSSKRFENEITPELALKGMNEACGLLAEIIPGIKFGPIVDVYDNRAKQTVFVFDPKYLKERLGLDIPEAEARNILEKIGMGISILENGQWSIAVPYERLDIKSREDIVEEVGRIYGYDKVKGILPPPHQISKVPSAPHFYLSEIIKSALVEMGFSEVSLYSLVHEGHVEAIKPLAKDKAFARKNLSAGMMDCVEKNALNADLLGLDIIKVFEIGHIFTEKTEKIHLAMGTTIVKKVKGKKSEDIIEEAVKKLEEELKIDIKGHKSSDKKGNVSVVEIDIDALANEAEPDALVEALRIGQVSENRYKRFSLYPFIVRDIAVFVPENTSSEDVWASIKGGIEKSKAFDLVVRHTLFDTFKKDGKISYAFRIVFQSMEKTLTDEEINAVMAGVNDVVSQKGWEVR